MKRNIIIIGVLVGVFILVGMFFIFSQTFYGGSPQVQQTQGVSEDQKMDTLETLGSEPSSRTSLSEAQKLETLKSLH